ncbi:protein of unknown function - conserved [Leishmania donovani]|uniref:Uncharacterized protein n=4 Tax=Leishmania donovani species complex TaxID=38574 RepID=A4HU32_LEIIN|nr:conserved hypothetical protein [Leishmania infantum JPCM5]XP_003858794.1 hypothetical protein, conserved [Leishmania donovani]CAC9455051.1 hypothetical_protein_-__conserved [Leishmania infantum]AYU76557.1 hypothetical protein LdCL_090018000 [Leishmania donovani]CAJ1986626.1 protein of unknown function - conserved [Leishmania donovani]CAM65938.2 conserved hypothetical protein [Leishmania infantum JPCM5]CBZ32074.1 hypothetical protein, conserved [Leishmania donovani]|eukprot:XP_001463573.2 conserved hypothetical protein [Leishmania infantum JPCM5]
MATIPTNTATATAPSKGGRAAVQVRSPSGSPLPNIELDEATIALIKENEQMLQTITTLQHELDKQQVRLNDAETARASLVDEVAELRSQLGLATSEATTSTGKVLNYKTAFTDLQHAFDQLKRDSDATKEKLEEATKRERVLMQSASNTARQQSQMKESFDLVTLALRMPNSFLISIQRIMEKLNDPALRPADRKRKLKDDIDRLQAQVAAYEPDMSSSVVVSADGTPSVDIPIRQCVYAFLSVIMTLLKNEVGK